MDIASMDKDELASLQDDIEQFLIGQGYAEEEATKLWGVLALDAVRTAQTAGNAIASANQIRADGEASVEQLRNEVAAMRALMKQTPQFAPPAAPPESSGAVMLNGRIAGGEPPAVSQDVAAQVDAMYGARKLGRIA